MRAFSFLWLALPLVAGGCFLRPPAMPKSREPEVFYTPRDESRWPAADAAAKARAEEAAASETKTPASDVQP
jgi:hypothetical protein